MKAAVYRKTGMLPAKRESRQFIASQLRQWRSQGKVRKVRMLDAIAYQAEDRCNPYVALIAL